MQNNTAKNNSGNDLDITQIPTEDVDQLASAIETFYKQDGSVKSRLSYHWERIMRMLDGDQWLVWSGDREQNGSWSRLQVSKANEYIPRPVTNYMFDAYQTLKAYLTKTKPRSSIRPNTQSFRDKSAAKVGQLCIEANYERLKDQENYEYAASILVAYGTVFKKTYWDTSAGNLVKIPKKVQQPKVNPNTGMQVGMEDVDAKDEFGDPVFEYLPIGDIGTYVIDPMRMALDPLASDAHTSRWILEYAIQPLPWIMEMFGKTDPGYTGRAEEVKAESQLSGSMERYYKLKNSAGLKDNVGIASTSGGSSTELTNCAVVKEYYERPTTQYPSGRMIVVANGIPLYAGDSPFSGPDQGDWHPYSECRWEIVPGRFWGKGPLDNIAELQKRVNSIDATVILTRKTMAIPQKLVPLGCGIENGQWTGRPGQQLNYRAEAGTPTTIPSAGVDATVFKEREQVVDDIKNISGAIDILKGDRPPGVTASSALSLLYEVGTGKLFPVLDRWKRFVKTDQTKELRLIAKNYKEPREDYIALLKQKNNELSEESISRFIGTDLYDNCNVVVEAGSNVPKLEAMRQMRLQEAAQVGTLNLELPANRMEFNRQMGITGFDNDVGPDVTRAEWENDLMDNVLYSPDNQPIVLNCDDDAVHIQVHERRMKEPSFMEQPMEVQQAFIQHIEKHHESEMQKQQQQMMQAMMTGQQPMQEAAANDPSQVSGHGKGAPSTVREAMAKADVPPGEMPR